MKADDEIQRRIAELERTSRLKDDLFGVVSHELRAPLHAILGWAEILLARAEVSPDDRRGLEAIARNARIQAQVIEDALDLNRIASGKLRLDCKPTDLAAAAQAAIETARPLATNHEIQLAHTIDPALSAIAVLGDVDPQRLQQVLGHLLGHAIRATPPRGDVALVVRRADGQVELAVEFDGVPPVNGTRTASHNFDVGLSLVKSLVELHGGALRVERGLRHAAAFVVRLPLRTGDAVRPTTAALLNGHTTGQAPSLDGLKILVIDDDGDARELVKTILTQARAHAVTAASADEGLAVLRDLHPDLIISDIGMALRDGYQFMRLVRTMSSSEGGRTPALALTAHVQTEDRTRALLAGYQEHISKPVEARQLIAAVHRLTSADRADA
ncbi:MAG TPA: hybrid sensor histidine kinase/response regulator [Kofleriaceae bacterium]|nr:hybrid sensor histidine kinase/response regulator [Kofleriaceae bacterium]